MESLADGDETAVLQKRRLFVAASVIPAAVHLGLAAVFYALDEPTLAHWDLVGAAVHFVGTAFVLRHRLYTGAWIVIGSACIHVPIVCVAIGLESGWGYYFLCMLAVPLVLFRDEPRHMLVSGVVCSASAMAGVVGVNSWDPWILFDPAVLDAMHEANLLASTGALFAVGILLVRQTMRTRRQLSRLRKEVAEARQLGQYTLGDPIGQGGMGQVYHAEHALLRRPAAIKLLREGEVSETAMRRFEREVQLTAELTHPNTIAIYDYGHTPEGLFYYVMEYLEGLDLQALVERYGPQSPGRVVHLLEQACEALEEAHANGLVHRDIKPANMVLCRRGKRPDVVKLLDFGLVKDLGAEDATAENVLAGTPAYLSPEAIADPDTLGPSSDLYALGAVGYFLLTGEQVFEGKTLAAICAAHLHDTPTPPHERLGAPIPEALEELILSCLEKKAEKRPPDAHGLRRSLEEVDLAEPWSEDAANAWWAEHDEGAAAPRERAAAATPAGGQSVTVDVRNRRAVG